jgi:hypothetical protein
LLAVNILFYSYAIKNNNSNSKGDIIWHARQVVDHAVVVPEVVAVLAAVVAGVVPAEPVVADHLVE